MEAHARFYYSVSYAGKKEREKLYDALSRPRVISIRLPAPDDIIAFAGSRLSASRIASRIANNCQPAPGHKSRVICNSRTIPG